MPYADLLATLVRDGATARATLTADWLQGRTAYGGWQAALGLHAMRGLIGHEAPLRSLQVNFVAPIAPGEITATATLLRQGRSAAQVEARILVNGQVAFTAVGIFGSTRPSAITLRPTAPPVVAPDNLPALPYIEGITPAFTRHFDMRWASGQAPYSAAPNGEMSIYVRFRGEPLSDEASLVCLGDAIPPSAISMFASPTSMSSMNWTLELVRPLTEATRQGWLRFDASLTAADDGYAYQNAAIWAENGELIALSRQCVAVFG